MTLGDGFDRALAGARINAQWAWTALYRDLAPSILGFLRARGVAEPEDLTGEVFLNIVRDLPSFEGSEKQFRTWALTITHRRLVDHWRRAGRHPAEPVPPDALVLGGPAGDVEHDAMARLGTRRVREAVGRLTPEQQDVILLRVVADLTVGEIAQIVGKRPGAVKALQRRALRALEQEISP